MGNLLPGTLYQDSRVTILEDDDRVADLHLIEGRWTPAVQRLAKRFGARGICLSPTKEWADHDLSFLKHFPDLKMLNVSLPFQWADHSLKFLTLVPELTKLILSGGPQIRWEQVERLTQLKELAAFTLSPTPSPRPINFAALTCLAVCRIEWSEGWKGILQAPQIKALEVSEMLCDIPKRLTRLDCSQMRSLRKVSLLGCKRLESVILGSPNRLQEVRINGSPRLRLASVLGDKLKKLAIIGSVASGWAEIERAQNLKHLQILEAREIGSLGFLRRLPNLETVAVQGRLSFADNQLVSAINQRFKARRKKRPAT